MGMCCYTVYQAISILKISNKFLWVLCVFCHFSYGCFMVLSFCIAKCTMGVIKVFLPLETSIIHFMRPTRSKCNCLSWNKICWIFLSTYINITFQILYSIVVLCRNIGPPNWICLSLIHQSSFWIAFFWCSQYKHKFHSISISVPLQLGVKWKKTLR